MSVSRDQVLDFLRQHPERPLKVRQLARVLRIPDQSYRTFRRLVKQMEQEGDLVRLRNNRYSVPHKEAHLIGRLSIHPEGFGFVALESGGPDIYLPDPGRAFHGDRVMVRTRRAKGAGKSPEGQLVRILEHSLTTVIGTYHPEGAVGFVHPDDARLTRPVFIPKHQAKNAEDGHKVIARIEAFPEGQHHPEGRIVEVLGNEDDPRIDTLVLIKKHNLPLEFPAHVEAAVEQIPDKIPEAEIQKRLDLRTLTCFTIDPPDARDFDDAVSLEPLSDGTYRLGVHIADVSHYISEGSPLDREAFARGTSVYFPDRVIPMLPERLSNRLCSLQPDEDRLTVSVLARLTPEGQVLNAEIADTVICSQARLSYEEVHTVLEGQTPPDSRAPQFAETLVQMETLRGHLTRQRIQRGAIDFDIPEPRIILDDQGVPIDIQKSERLNSHRLIEEFMLLANQIVAEHLKALEIPTLYRVHARPDRGKLEGFVALAATFGHRLPKPDRIGPGDIQHFLQTLQGEKIGSILNQALLQAMKKATYTPKNIGHFGLALETYTHFTSPIRRYPDLIVHRILRQAQSGKLPPKDRLRDHLQTTGDQATAREIAAQEAEREAIKCKQVRFLEPRLGDLFNATIVNVRPIGLFVALDESLIEGLIHVSALQDDYYRFHDAQSALVGERTGRIFQPGDSIEVQLVRTDRKHLHIDFLLVDQKPNSPKSRSRRKRRPGRQPRPQGYRLPDKKRRKSKH
ncbi:MAG: ribonuclease R [bacterium]|nr:ribonuclease R [bacterium]